MKNVDALCETLHIGLNIKAQDLRILKQRVYSFFECSSPQITPPAWMPIETAPKDGDEVLLRVKNRAGIPGCQVVGHYMLGGHCIEDHPPIARGWYFWNGRMFDEACEPTHWMPLPKAP